MGGRDLFGAIPHTLKNGVATPHTIVAIHGLENLFNPPVSGISEKAIGFGQYGRPQELRIPAKGRTDSVADSTEDAVDVWIDLLPFILTHYVFQRRWDRYSVKIEFHFPKVIEKRGMINDEVSNGREVGEGFDENGFSQEAFDRGPTGQNYLTVDPHGARATYCTPAGITEAKRPIFLILDL
jgi:hypothetical protein